MQRYFFSNEAAELLDRQMQAVLEEMQRIGVTHEEYPKLMTYLERLQGLKAKGRREPLSRDTLAIIGGNLLGILLIVVYEQKHVLTSKAVTQLIRPK